MVYALRDRTSAATLALDLMPRFSHIFQAFGLSMMRLQAHAVLPTLRNGTRRAVAARGWPRAQPPASDRPENAESFRHVWALSFLWTQAVAAFIASALARVAPPIPIVEMEDMRIHGVEHARLQ